MRKLYECEKSFSVLKVETKSDGIFLETALVEFSDTEKVTGKQSEETEKEWASKLQVRMLVGI